jgi:uncharacterized protein (DUF433 family)
MSAVKRIETPRFGEGIYSTQDVADILHLKYHSVKYLMKGYWQASTFGRERNKTVNFLGLIEFYFYYYLRKRGLSAHKIKKIHQKLSQDFNTSYPFASLKLKTQEKEIWVDYFGLLLKADGKRQPSFREIVEPFLDQIEYGDDFLAQRFYPLKQTKNVVVDPKKQFGKPIVNGRGVRTEVIYRFYLGGESKESICKLYELDKTQVEDAILYHQPAA